MLGVDILGLAMFDAVSEEMYALYKQLSDTHKFIRALGLMTNLV